jgi:hypothetical protein
MTFEIGCQTLRAEAYALTGNCRNCQQVRRRWHNHHHDQGQIQREKRTQLHVKTLIIGDEYPGKKWNDAKKKIFPLSLLTNFRKFCMISPNKKMHVNSTFRMGNVLKIKKLKKVGLGLDKGKTMWYIGPINKKNFWRLEKQ